ncbi:hypothetical protein Moror_17789 [Moniliophthora roreri MCA 2997]|uniref:Uncharacterized protein n=1 Tax=Moniliophthora roreri (strain MCA 2997) TaxID=1381753 RepID=V2XDT6_MONRO|nr:hypothetical protein Moror_17789 [Moniliophthora roreri MCA 2997]
MAESSFYLCKGWTEVPPTSRQYQFWEQEQLTSADLEHYMENVPHTRYTFTLFPASTFSFPPKALLRPESSLRMVMQGDEASKPKRWATVITGHPGIGGEQHLSNLRPLSTLLEKKMTKSDFYEERLFLFHSDGVATLRFDDINKVFYLSQLGKDAWLLIDKVVAVPGRLAAPLCQRHHDVGPVPRDLFEFDLVRAEIIEAITTGVQDLTDEQVRNLLPGPNPNSAELPCHILYEDVKGLDATSSRVRTSFSKRVVIHLRRHLLKMDRHQRLSLFRDLRSRTV